MRVERFAKTVFLGFFIYPLGLFIYPLVLFSALLVDGILGFFWLFAGQAVLAAFIGVLGFVRHAGAYLLAILMLVGGPRFLKELGSPQSVANIWIVVAPAALLLLHLLVSFALGPEGSEDKCASRPAWKRVRRFSRAIVGFLVGLVFFLYGALGALWRHDLSSDPSLFTARFLMLAAAAAAFYLTSLYIGSALEVYFPRCNESDLVDVLEVRKAGEKRDEFLADFRKLTKRDRLSLEKARDLLDDLVNYSQRNVVREKVSFVDDFVQREIKIEPIGRPDLLVLSCPEKGDHHRGYRCDQGDYATVRHVTAQALLIEALLTCVGDDTLEADVSELVGYASNEEKSPKELLEVLGKRPSILRLSDDDRSLVMEALAKLIKRRPYVAHLRNPEADGDSVAAFSYIEHPGELVNRAKKAPLNWVQKVLAIFGVRNQILGLEVHRAGRCRRYVMDFESPEGTYLVEVAAADLKDESKPKWLPSLNRESIYEGFLGWLRTVGGSRVRFVWTRPTKPPHPSSKGVPGLGFLVLYLRLRESHPNGLDVAFSSCLFTSLSIWISAMATQFHSLPVKDEIQANTDVASLLVALQALFFALRAAGYKTPNVAHAVQWKVVVLINSVLSLYALALYFAVTRGVLEELPISPLGDLLLVKQSLWQVVFGVSCTILLYSSLRLSQSYRDYAAGKKFVPRSHPSELAG